MIEVSLDRLDSLDLRALARAAVDGRMVGKQVEISQDFAMLHEATGWLREQHAASLRKGIALASVSLFALAFPSSTRGDVIRLSDGMVLVGLSDRDEAIVDIFDYEGLRRVVVRATRVAETRSEPAPKAERFRLVQPITVHAGEMPREAIGIEATPWDASGRRTFRYRSATSSRPRQMTQAINELGPYAAKYRGIDGFWLGGEALDLVPREVVLGLLHKVDPKDQNERLRVGRFLIQAEWFPEAYAELDRLEQDFPDLKPTIGTVRSLVRETEARRDLDQITLREAAGQPRAVARALRALPADALPAELATQVRDRLRAIDVRAAEDRSLATSLRNAADALPPQAREVIEPHLLEMLRDLSDAPDAVRDRLVPFASSDPSQQAEQRLALALSGWIAGPDRATTDSAAADTLWTARDLLAQYLSATDVQSGLRLELVAKLRELRLPAAPEPLPVELPQLADIVARMRPVVHDDRATVSGQVRVIRVYDDPNPDRPSEYAVRLPTEYHPLRHYPALVVLHGPEAPADALTAWSEQADRRGYILIAPEWAGTTADGSQAGAYRFTADEHAAVLLALRDARKRFAIDADRVYLSGMLEGAHMAWDFGLAHPDMFAGVAPISGLPAKFAWAYREHTRMVPFLIVEGELAPAENVVVFEQWAKPQVLRDDVIYMKYFKRGMERFPEAIPDAFAWMAGRVRDPAPKQFSALSAREGDDRFFGIVIRNWAPGRVVRPEGARIDGKNINPAEVGARANTVLNKLLVTSSGVTQFDVWVSPQVLDFNKRITIQVGEREVFKGVAKLDDPAAYLEDLRLRADREQPFWLKVPVRR